MTEWKAKGKGSELLDANLLRDESCIDCLARWRSGKYSPRDNSLCTKCLKSFAERVRDERKARRSERAA